jgi:hypothetical protein
MKMVAHFSPKRQLIFNGLHGILSQEIWRFILNNLYTGSFRFLLICAVHCGLVVRVPGYRSRGTAFDSLRYQIFWEVVGLERGPLSLMSTIEELLGRNSSGSGLENREYGHGDPLRWPRDTIYPQKLALISLGRYRSLEDQGPVCLVFFSNSERWSLN